MELKTDPRQLRQCFGRFATGVTVVSYRGPDGVRGATMNSFTSVSIEPPLVLISLARASNSYAALEAGQPFTINVLGADQIDLALHFAGRPRPDIRIDWDAADSDAAPGLSGAVAVLQCRPWQRYDGGDHLLLVGEVTASQHRD